MHNSDSEDDNIHNWSHRCTCCNTYCGTDDTEYYDETDSTNESFSDETSNEEFIDDDILFISLFNHKTQKNKNFVSNATEIQNYREKYNKLSIKNTQNIQNIWAEVKVDMPILGNIPLKQIDTELSTNTKNEANIKKKKFKKPTHLIENKLPSATSLNNSEQSDIMKANVIPKSIPNQNKNSNNDKLDKIEVSKSNVKNTVTNISSTKTSTSSIQPNTQNSSKKESFDISDQKLKLESSSTKVNIIKTKTENKIEKNKEKSSINSTLIKKIETKEMVETSKINSNKQNTKTIPGEKVDKLLNKSEIKPNNKTNEKKPENKIEKSNLTKANKKNAENKIKKTDSTKSNIESGEKNKNSNKNENDKNSKSDAALFKIPDSNKVITPFKSDKKENTQINQNVQLNENNSVKKLSKKQEKKRRQREKKLKANCGDTSTSSSRDVSVSSTNSCNDKNSKGNKKNFKEEVDKPKKDQVIKSEKRTKNKKSTESEHSEQNTGESDMGEMSTSCDGLDLLTDTEHVPTFVADILKRKEKNKRSETKVPKTPTKNKNKKKNHEQEKIKIDSGEEFIKNFKTRKYSATVDQNCIMYSDRYAEEGVEMILENNLMAALEYITVAIDCNPSDFRHYLNRSYCYLRMNQPAYALADVQYVIRLCTNIGHRFLANLRAGQAACALANYKQAEIYLKEATSINPENYHAQRELIRVKILHIMSLGFKEQDALMALQKYPSVLEAINYLKKDKKKSSLFKFKSDFRDSDYNCDNMVFISDDEEEMNNFETLNMMLNYQPGKIKFQHLVAKPMNSEYVLDKISKPKILDYKKTPDVKKKIVNDKAIWVGNLTNSITDQMLKKKFKQFGSVISVYRPCNEAYAFINFERSEDVTQTLINTSSHEIAGVKLAVRAAAREK